MKLLYFSNEFPHDDLQELLRKLSSHAQDRKHPILAAFIEVATAAVREETRLLPESSRALIPPLTSIFGLAELPTLRKGPLGGSIEGALLCAVEIGALIGYYEKCPSEYSFDPSTTYLAGLGIGLLASAAVSLSPTLADLPVVGAEVVRLAFRLGILVDEVSQNLQPRDNISSGPPESWAYVIPEVEAAQVQKELNIIHVRDKTPLPSKVFISALSPTSVTVSGPPSRLKNVFLQSDFFRDRKHVSLPVYSGLCHAEHIYNNEHVNRVVNSPFSTLISTAPGLPVFSTSAGKSYAVQDAKELFSAVIHEVLTQKIEWENVITGFLDAVKNHSAKTCEILIFRASLPVHDLLLRIDTKLPSLNMKTTELISWIGDTDNRPAPRGTAQSKIAIVGMSCRMPSGATNTEKFWELLEKGLDVHKEIPADRFDVDSHHDSTGKRVNTSHTRYGCFIDEPGLFDAPFFNMSPREAQQTDPMQRLALVTAYEALERSGYVANRTASTRLPRIGTFYGQASDDYREVNTAQEISTYFIPGGCRAFGPGRINYFFKFAGPSFSIDTACSSSLATIQAACTSLWAGECDTAIAGGMNVLTNSDAFAGLSHGHFLSKTPNACKTWDAEADGYCRADGIGSIVIKRLEDAEADNDNILGVILGAATNHSAEAVSITHPHAGAQAYLSRQVLRSAGIDPHAVSYVEMHGTGTQAGDHEEMQSVSEVFASAKRPRSSKNPLYVGAVKANVGHGEAVAGVTALLKVLLMFQKEIIPAHVGIKNSLNPAFPKDLDRRNLRIPYEKIAWPRVPGKKRIAAVNNFSAAGGNTCIAIEEGPVQEVVGSDPRDSHVIVVSAKSKVSMKGNLERLITYIDQEHISLADLAYTTTARRYHHNHRIGITATSIKQLKSQLSTHLASVDSLKAISATGPPPVAFAFTGQGSSYKSSDLELYKDCPVFMDQIHHLNDLVQAQGFASIVPALDGTFPNEHAHSAVITQLALVCTQIALAKYWESLGVKPDVVVGHSLGEYAAMHVAGVLSASDAIFLVGKRAQMLEEKCTSGSHKMVAVRASLVEIQQSVGDLSFEIACINGPKEIVLSGTVAQVNALMKPLQGAGIKCSSLDVAFAFHSAQMDAILDDFTSLAQTGVHFHAPNLPIVSPLLSKVIFDECTIDATYLRRATRETVNFRAALKLAESIGTIDETTVWVELGPHPVCTSFIKSNLSPVNIAVPSMRRAENNWSTISQSLAALHCAGVRIGWNEFHRPYERALTLLDLPTYAWNDKNYWIQYNGNWALTKGNTFYEADKKLHASSIPVALSSLRTSTVQQIVQENIDGLKAEVTMQADLMHSDFLAAAYGHKMNGCGVVTSSIHADIAYTLGEYLYKKLFPGAKKVSINIADLVVLKGLVAQKNKDKPQLLQVTIATEDIRFGEAKLKWYNVDSNGGVDESFANATLHYGDDDAWLASWVPLSHLIQGRIQALERLAEEGIANRFSHGMAYRLFANLVDYAEKYRGMRSVVMHGLEAYADVQLTTEKGGTWTVPPYFIDSVAHLAGFAMNVSEEIDTKANFCVTPGWSSMRFAKPLIPGGVYRSYVKMIQSKDETNVYLGDVYVLQDGEIIGMVGAIKFCQYPRILLDRFFSPPDDTTKTGKHSPAAPTKSAVPAKAVSKSTPTASSTLKAPKMMLPAPISKLKPPVAGISASQLPPTPATSEGDPMASASTDSDSIAAKAIVLIANEAALDLEELKDDVNFADVGVDSLMSLVIAEKFREELGVTMSGSLFLEYPSIGDLRAWLVEYYG